MGILAHFRSFLLLLVIGSFNAACSSSMRCPPQVMRWKAMMRKSISSRVETSCWEQWIPPAQRSSCTAAKNSHHDVLSAAQKDTVLRWAVGNFSSSIESARSAPFPIFTQCLTPIRDRVPNSSTGRHPTHRIWRRK